ncbi:hypothetical protein BU25DRAFT_406648 [Macroventuria anomochaeta]|uniref:Uncharacterized protein n=1 Tax=Macroventuria anomochaeta TaxID=301207 RepID=A0ACB6SEU7_9PLEO|nr:uncharacterized protein BU25DRAFT_406648 [Macroventuria anomochaeta]KAF2632125.1 hypothetical protein BU25DRAFT_406648 [Macroventuria anomochaeta]
MKPGALPLRVQSRPVCQLCEYILLQPVSRRAFLTAPTLKTASIRRQTARTQAAIPRIPARRIQTSWRNVDQADFPEAAVSPQSTSDSIAAVKTRLAEVEAQIKHIFDSNKVEGENTIYRILEGIEEIAASAIAIRSRQPPPTKTTIRQSSAGAILSGLNNEETPTQKRRYTKPLGLNELPTPTYLSKLAEGLLKHPTVFIGPNVLKIYIRLQRLLNRPHAIPEILYLYANKPVPQEGSSPPNFSKPSPKSASQAIPADLADESLTAAIEAKDLSLALAVIDHTYRAPAWTRHRMLTKMGLPGVLAAMTPLAIYMIAQELSVYSGYIDPWTFKMYAFAGMSTYVMCTGTLGFVALTTYNDDHDRVVWRPGVPLLDRYVRADERAALDRIACAWGFKEVWKRGDEEGEEWEGLRQLCLLRGMWLDKPDLMPGMNPGR